MKKKIEKMTAPKMVTAIVKKVGKAPRIINMPYTWEAIQSQIGGYIGHLESKEYDPNNVLLYDGEAWGVAEENMLGICGTFLVLGRTETDSFGSVMGPQTVCTELREAAPDDIL